MYQLKITEDHWLCLTYWGIPGQLWVCGGGAERDNWRYSSPPALQHSLTHNCHGESVLHRETLVRGQIYHFYSIITSRTSVTSEWTIFDPNKTLNRVRNLNTFIPQSLLESNPNLGPQFSIKMYLWTSILIRMYPWISILHQNVRFYDQHRNVIKRSQAKFVIMF